MRWSLADHAVERSRFAINVLRENFAWALVYNLIALPFAASGAISPWMAAIGMSVSSLIVVLNALRLKYNYANFMIFNIIYLFCFFAIRLNSKF